MQSLIEHLVKLQSIELGRAGLNQKLRALPAEIAQADAALATAERKLSVASAALAKEEELRTRLDREIAAQRQKAARSREHLDAVTTPAQAEAIEHEIEFASAEADRLESDEYASLERTETQEAARTSASAEVERYKAEAEAVRNEVAAAKQQIGEQMTALDVDRNAERAQIEPDWLARFDRIAASRGTGIARAVNQQCMGCSMGLRPQLWNQLREGELVSCDSCSRLLYWAPETAPAAEEPRPELPPGTGRAPRRPRPANL